MGGFVNLNLLADLWADALLFSGTCFVTGQNLRNIYCSTPSQAFYNWVENSVVVVRDTGKHLEHFRGGRQANLRAWCEPISGLNWAAVGYAITICGGTMNTRSGADSCCDPKFEIVRCVGQPTTCPPGCPKRKAIQLIPEQPGRDVHSAPAPLDCLGCTLDHKPRACRPRSKPIYPKPYAGTPDRFNTETFLDTFDCQELPWRSSSHRVEQNYDHIHRDVFRPSVGQGKLTADNLGSFASAELKPWKSCSRYIPSEPGKPLQWRSCIRYIGDKNSKEKAWRSSVRSNAPLEGGYEKPYRSQIVVKGGDGVAYAETTEVPFKPTLRYIPEFYPNRPDWRPSRAHVCTKKCYHSSPRFNHIYNSVPAFETKQKTPRNIRKSNPLFEKEHPVGVQFDDVQAHDDLSQCPQGHEEDHLLPRTGKKRIPWPVRSNPTYADGRNRNRRRIIFSGHIDHLDSSCLCCCKKKDAYRPTIRILNGRQHHSVVQRNVIAGPLEPGNEHIYNFRTLKQRSMAPHGTYNQDIIAGRFHRYKRPKEPLTEQRAQFTKCKPQVSQEIYNEANQAYKENRCNDAEVHPSITRFLYEDRYAVVS